MSLEELRKYLESLEKASFRRGIGYEVQTADGLQTFTAAELSQEQARVRDEISTLETTARQEGEAQAARQLSLRAGQKALSEKDNKLIGDFRRASEKLNELAGSFARGATQLSGDLTKWEKTVNDLESKLNKSGLFVSTDGSIVRQLRTGQTEVVSAAVGQPTGVTGRVAGAMNAPGPDRLEQTGQTGASEGAGAGRPSGVAGVAGAAGGGKVNAAKQNAYITRELDTRGLSDTPRNRKRLREEYQKLSSSDAWLDTFKQDYPGYADWTTADVAAYFGQDFIDVLMKAADPDVEYSDDEIRRMVRNTAYYNSTTSKQQDFDKATPANQQRLIDAAVETIRTDYGDLNFTESDILNLGRTVARSGLTGAGLRQEVFRTAFRSQAPREVQTQAMTGAQADAIQQLARSFGRSASNDEIQSILTGQPTADGRMLTSEMFRQQLQQEAIAAFPQLQKQIEAGLSLATIGSRYKQYAADLLERDPEQIDMFQGPYLEAFGNAQDGPLSLGDWVTKVKSDERFGWQYTNQANQQATDVALTLARAFGKVE